jgi:hypothetical protein
VARNRHIAEGAEAVWTYAAEMLRDAVAKGHLPK